MKIRLQLLGVFAALAAPVFVQAADIIFMNGSREQDAEVINISDGSASLKVRKGFVRVPVASIRSIDGERPEDYLGISTPDAAPPEPAIPEATPGTTPSRAPVPASSQQAEQNPPAEITPPASPDYAFLLVLLGALLAGGVWMRSLQAVQRSLYQRRADPRAWTNTALLLPGLGAVLYFASLRWRETRERAAVARKAGKDAPKTPKKSSADSDPAEYASRPGRTRKGLTFLDTDRKSVELKRDTELTSGLEHAGEMLEEALLEKASDIHIEPTNVEYRVRFRLDGILHERMSYDSLTGRRVVTALKTLAEIDIAEKRRAQDGRFQVRFEDREVDFRVATANSIHGEKMVIRVLDHRIGIFDLPALGMPPAMLAQFQDAIHSRNGMILATGPTGSGKTSTLYAALRQLDSRKLNIMTIEDPAEFELDGATQIAVNPRAGITYEGGLRSILRQDPDVIFVGEMRDTEASAVALRAALTGHLVFSTLHTKDAIGTITRLQDMGIERYQIGSALLMVIAQRLVRVLCQKCRSPYPASGGELSSIGINLSPGIVIHGPVGCPECMGTGFKGRTGLFELLVFDDALRKAVSSGAEESELAALAAERGYKSYRRDGLDKILQGVTTVDEVLQAS